MALSPYDTAVNSASVDTDVVIVGGGPAGSVTALLLARQGYRVTLLERQQFPRAKPCGDCLSPGANQILRRIGVWPDVMSTNPALLRGWRMIAPNQAAFTATFESIGGQPESVSLAIERATFDAVLLNHARHAGVAVLTAARVTDLVHARDGSVVGVSFQCAGEPATLRARLTVGADGLRSIIARRLHAHPRRPRLRKVSFTMHASLPDVDQLGIMRIARGACLGIAPVLNGTGPRTHNVTLVLSQGEFAAHAGAGRIVDQALARFGLPMAEVRDADVLTSGPFDWPVRHVSFCGAALVGDAAGYYDPFTGQGIYQALAGAELLAEHAGRALRNTHTSIQLRDYARAQQRLSVANRRLQRVIEFVCARPWLADRVFAKLAARPEVAQALVGVTGDVLPSRTLFSRRLLMRLAA
jgi:flavin-dependent dehydrogenase